MTSGPVMTTIGIGAVFVALVLLIAVVVITSRLINRRENGGGRNSPQVVKGARCSGEGRGGGSKNASGSNARRPNRALLLRIALAAYGLHRRNSVTVRAPESVSHWGTVSRVAQPGRFPGKV